MWHKEQKSVCTLGTLEFLVMGTVNQAPIAHDILADSSS